jgi:hypothetical protein
MARFPVLLVLLRCFTIMENARFSPQSAILTDGMRVTIRQLKTIPIPALNTDSIYCDGASENEILFVFSPPSLEVVHVGDVVELEPSILEKPQTVLNVTKGTRFTTELRKRNIHDLRLPASHGSSRFPSPERFNAA